ncbi:MAG: hypothetical protein JWN17_2692 [Frankiales bacterium]|nr:hypothetical protein [Frankiales bacterium]
MPPTVRTRALLAAVLLSGLLSACGGQPPPASCRATAPGARPVTLAVEQASAAATIAAVGVRLGVPDHAVTVALATAQQESGLRNLDHGDRDSLGLFQQRPSQGWGTPSQVRDPVHASRAFYRRLLAVPGWQRLSVTQAAQAVQLSAFPTAYAQHETRSRVLARVLTGEVAAGLSCRGLPRAPALRARALQEAADAELGPGRLHGATTPKTRRVVAAWLVAHAQQFGVREVGADRHHWTAAGGRWATSAADGPVAFQ